jgi:hypothetical protein
VFEFSPFVIGVQQIEKIFSLARTTFRSSHNMVFVGQKILGEENLEKRTFGWIFYLLCCVKLAIIPTLFVSWNPVTFM